MDIRDKANREREREISQIHSFPNVDSWNPNFVGWIPILIINITVFAASIPLLIPSLGQSIDWREHLIKQNQFDTWNLPLWFFETYQLFQKPPVFCTPWGRLPSTIARRRRERRAGAGAGADWHRCGWGHRGSTQRGGYHPHAAREPWAKAAF